MVKSSEELRLSYTGYTSRLIKICRKQKISYKVIGSEKFEKLNLKYPLYRVDINPKGKKKFIVIAGTHGDEIAGPLSLLFLLQESKKYLNQDYHYLIYPVINPTGFDFRTRKDDDNRDLNNMSASALKSKNYREVKVLYKDMEKVESEVFIALHEDLDEDRFYAYVFEKGQELIYREMIKRISRSCKIWKSKRIYENKSDGQGLVINAHDQSIEDRVFCLGKARLSLCTETPGKLPLKKRIEMNLKNIKFLSDFYISFKNSSSISATRDLSLAMTT